MAESLRIVRSGAVDLGLAWVLILAQKEGDGTFIYT
jgi:hypothetical protein